MRPRRAVLLALVGVLVVGGSATAAALAGSTPHPVQRVTFTRSDGPQVTCPTKNHCIASSGGRRMVVDFSEQTTTLAATVSLAYDYRVSRNAVCQLVVGLDGQDGSTSQVLPIYRRVPHGMGSTMAVFSVADLSPTTTYRVRADLEAAARQGTRCTLSKLVVTVDAAA